MENHSAETLWNFDSLPYEDIFSCDTVGAVALDIDGSFAVATSTGGAPPMMTGRVGDSPMIGCGFYAGPWGAVAMTGIGEEIIKRMLAKTVYDMVSRGEEIKAASKSVISMFPPDVTASLIVLSQEGFAVAANRQMAHSVRLKEES